MAKIPKLEPRDIVRIEWIDAHSHDAWTDKEELDNYTELKTITTVGLFHKFSVKPRAIVVAHSIAFEDGSTCGIMVIPTGWIKKIEKLNESREEKTQQSSVVSTTSKRSYQEEQCPSPSSKDNTGNSAKTNDL